MKRFLAGVASGLAVIMASVSAQAASYDALSGFSSSNPSGPWSYLTANSTDLSLYPGDLSRAADYFSDCGAGTTCWDQSNGPSNLVLANSTGADVAFINSVARNGQLTFYTRSGLSLVRFTAPTAGLYTVNGYFEGSAIVPEISREFIAIDGDAASPISDSSAAVPLGTTNPFSFMSTLAAGDTIDFLVAGASTTPDTNSLATGFDATITGGTSVPEPVTWSLMLIGFGFVGTAVRGRRLTVESAQTWRSSPPYA